jgi:hypothetical protein
MPRKKLELSNFWFLRFLGFDWDFLSIFGLKTIFSSNSMLASTNIIFLLMLNIWLARVLGEKIIHYRFFAFEVFFLKF